LTLRKSFNANNLIFQTVEDGLELVARPMRRKRFALKDAVGIFAELAYPVRLALHIDDIIDGLLCQANTCIASRFEIIEKIADIAININ
jgi:hypothetical protein